MNDIAFTLNVAAHRHHAGGQDGAPVCLEHLRPYDQVGSHSYLTPGDRLNSLFLLCSIAAIWTQGGIAWQ
jgi:hypothetical protein